MIKNLLLISSYPEKGLTHGLKTVGGASYTKNLVTGLRAVYPNINISVYAEYFDKKTKYQDGGVMVKRVFKPKKVLSLIAMFRDLIKEKSKVVLISYELKMMGGFLQNLLFLLLLVLLKVRGKKIIIINHQTVGSFKDLEKNPIKRIIMNISKDLLYFYLLKISDSIIVFETQLKKYLKNSNKIIVIPHAVENFPLIDKTEARKKLGWDNKKNYALYFGYLSPYKGVKDLIDIYQPGKNWELVIAGGANPNYLGDKKYMDFTREVSNKAKDKNIICTGVIKEEEISLYYSACDFVVLPYKAFFSSSGPLSLAFSFEKPFLISPVLGDYFQTFDFQKTLKETGLTKEDFIFDFKTDSFGDKIKRMIDDRERYSDFSRLMKEKRQWSSISKQYFNLLSNKS